MKSWINDCMQNHDECKLETSYFPTRVIDVGPPDGTEEPRLRIVEGVRGPYIALSYCWGVSDLQHLTRTDTLQQKLESIPLERYISSSPLKMLQCRSSGFHKFINLLRTFSDPI